MLVDCAFSLHKNVATVISSGRADPRPNSGKQVHVSTTKNIETQSHAACGVQLAELSVHYVHKQETVLYLELKRTGLKKE